MGNETGRESCEIGVNDKPLHIVHAIPFYYPTSFPTGPVSVVRDLCKALVARGHRVSVLTTDHRIDAHVDRGRWVDLDGYRVWYAHNRALWDRAPFYAPGLNGAMDDALRDADVLHLSVGLTLVNVAARRRARRIGVPYVFSPHGVVMRKRLRIRRAAKAGFVRLFERGVIRDAAAVHALNAEERDDLALLGARDEQLCVIPNGVDLGLIDSESDGAAARESLGIGGDTPVVLFMGWVMREKGIDVLLDAFAVLRERVPKAVLVIAGREHREDGRVAKDQARSLGVESAVRFVGSLVGSRRLDVLHAADLFVLPSRSEGMPMAVLEACAAGVPVLITRECGLPEIAEHGAGLIEPLDARRMGDAMARVLIDRSLSLEMSQRGRAMVAKRFSVVRVVDQVESLYRRLVSEREG